MARLLFVALGAFLVLTMGGFVVAFGSDPTADPLGIIPTDPITTLRVVGWLLAGLLFLVGGLVRSVAGVEWYRLVGLADVLLGLAMVAPVPALLLGDGAIETGTLVYTVALGLGGLVLAFIGVDWFRGGHHLDLSRYEDGTSADA